MVGMARRVAAIGVLTLLFGGARAAGAQAEFLGAGAGFLGVGVSGIGTAELDDRLTARGYPAFGRTPLGVSLGAYRKLPGGVMLGGEWHGLVMGEEEHQGREVGLGGGYGTLGLGYLVELSPAARVYPRLGLGGGGMGLWMEGEGDEVGFDEVLAEPTPAANRQVVLSRGSMVVDLGAGAELLRGGRGPLIGVRVGYLAAPFASDWRLEGEWTEGEPVSGGPAASLAGPYFRAVVGLGWGR